MVIMAPGLYICSWCPQLCPCMYSPLTSHHPPLCLYNYWVGTSAISEYADPRSHSELELRSGVISPVLTLALPSVCSALARWVDVWLTRLGVSPSFSCNLLSWTIRGFAVIKRRSLCAALEDKCAINFFLYYYFFLISLCHLLSIVTVPKSLRSWFSALSVEWKGAKCLV